MGSALSWLNAIWNTQMLVLAAAATTKGYESSVGPMSHLPNRSLDVPRTSQMAPDTYIKQ